METTLRLPPKDMQFYWGLPICFHQAHWGKQWKNIFVRNFDQKEDISMKNAEEFVIKEGRGKVDGGTQA